MDNNNTLSDNVSLSKDFINAYTLQYYHYLTTAKQVLILGAGFGGLASANLLRKSLPREECQITVIDPSENSITTRTKHGKLEYDYLIVALGAELAPKLIHGFEDNGRCFNIYDAHQVPNLREKILSLKSGRIAICIVDIPYKCPPAPYEVSLLINDMLIKNGTRNSIDLNIYGPTPISLPVAGANISRDVVNLLNDNHIKFHELHKLKRVLDKKTVEFENGNKTSYDLLIVIPP